MADYGLKISKPGFDATDIPTEATKKNFIILDSTEAHKILHKGFVTSGSYTHGLNKRPIFFCFQTDSTTNPTYFTPARNVRATTTEIKNIPNPSYLVVFREGI